MNECMNERHFPAVKWSLAVDHGAVAVVAAGGARLPTVLVEVCSITFEAFDVGLRIAYPVASLGWVTPGAATEGVTL